MTGNRRRGRRTFTVALGASAVAHAALFAFLKIDVPSLGDDAPSRALEVVRLKDRADDALEVVRLEMAVTRVATNESAPSGAASTRAAIPPAGSGAATPPANSVPAVDPVASTASRALDLAPAAPRPATTPLVEARPANRGVVLARGGGPAGATSDFDFARDDETGFGLDAGFGADGRDGSGGIGISIMGIGGGGHCPTGLGGVDLFGPGGGLPAPRGKGIIGRRPPGGEAINRSLPGRDR